MTNRFHGVHITAKSYKHMKKSSVQCSSWLNIFSIKHFLEGKENELISGAIDGQTIVWKLSKDGVCSQ